MTDRPRPLWREPVLLAAAAVLVVAAVTVASIAYQELTSPVLQAPVDGDGVPTAYPHGESLRPVPEVLAEAFDRPVVLAASASEPLGDLERCRGGVEWEFAPTLRTSVITPEGLTVSIRGEERATEALLQVTCYAQWDGRSWQTWASWTADAADEIEPLGSVEPICCRGDGVALMGTEAVAPAGTAWAVQDRGPYWLAFPVDDSGLYHPVWLVEEADGPPAVVYLDARGDPVEEDPGPPVAPDEPGEDAEPEPGEPPTDDPP